MNYDLQITTDPRLIADLHVRELAEQGKEYAIEEVIEKWQKILNRYFIVAGTHGFTAFQERDGNSCYLSDLYVDPQCRGQGLGRALVFAVKCGHRYVELHVDHANVAARALYKSEGFSEIQPQEDNCQQRIYMKYTAAQQGAQPDAFGAG